MIKRLFVGGGCKVCTGREKKLLLFLDYKVGLKSNLCCKIGCTTVRPIGFV